MIARGSPVSRDGKGGAHPSFKKGGWSPGYNFDVSATVILGGFPPAHLPTTMAF